MKFIEALKKQNPVEPKPKPIKAELLPLVETDWLQKDIEELSMRGQFQEDVTLSNAGTYIELLSRIVLRQNDRIKKLEEILSDKI